MSNNRPDDISRRMMRVALPAGLFVNVLLALYAWAERSLSIFAVYTIAAWAAGSIGFIAGFLSRVAPLYAGANGACGGLAVRRLEGN